VDLRFHPATKLLDHSPMEWEIDAVVRIISPVSATSGSCRCPVENCAVQLGFGSHVPRNDHESIFPLSMSQRLSLSGSRPRKLLIARPNSFCFAPMVRTLDAMWVES